MLKVLSAIMALTDRKTRKGFVILGCVMIVGMGFEMASVGIFLPLFQILLDPEKATRLPGLSWLYHNLADGDLSRLTLLFTGILLVVFIAKAIVMTTITFYQNRFIFNRQAEFAARMLADYLQRPYGFHLQRNTAEIIRNITTLSLRLFSKSLLPILQFTLEALVVVGILAVLMMVDPVPTLLVSAMLSLAVLAFYLAIRKTMLHWGERTVLFERNLLQALQQALGAIKAIKLGNLQGYFLRSFIACANEKAYYTCMTVSIPAIPRLAIEVVAVAGMLLMLWIIIIFQERTPASALTTLGIFAVALVRLMPSFNRLVTNLSLIRENTSTVFMLLEEAGSAEKLAKAEESALNPPRLGPAPHFSEIALRDVSFSYPGTDKPALANVNLTIARGQSVAFIGRSGAGKSTLADIILGLLPPASGQLLLDGKDAWSDLLSWQRRIGYVPQEIYLVDDTLRRNVALGVPDQEIDAGKLARAIKDAHLEIVVAALPEGLDTVLGERGARLSGGQRQRIGIARALYHDPDVLVLDEATSALDSETEEAVIEAIHMLQGVKTMIIIAHRLSTVSSCDRTITLEEGRLISETSSAKTPA